MYSDVEAYSETCQTSDGAFQEKSERCSTVDYFCKSSVLDVWQSSQYASEKGPRVT